ncbi:hypothetical protein D1007_24678 [Hordeum vulgare]|nr:hypothetical protein D1007_24678 [Hordeum vulgare]
MRPPNQAPPPLTAAIERIYKPSSWEPRLEVQRRERSELLKKIIDSYDHVRERLAMATTFKEEAFIGAGLSVGLLNPATNIIYNTLTASDLCADEIKGAQQRDIAERSLDGLVAFLVSFFRYLDDWEAVRYLLLADTYLLYAMRLIVHDRCLSFFNINSDIYQQVRRPHCPHVRGAGLEAHGSPASRPHLAIADSPSRRSCPRDPG